MILKISCICIVCFLQQNIYSQTDSVKTLYPVKVMHTVSKETHRSTAPLQLLSKETLDKLPILQLSDALKLLPGITIKDYGGVGGMKTVAVRGLGANHTGVAYDGIVLSDEQTGQIDIGKVSLSHLSGIAVANGISDNLLTPARLHAFASQANMLSRQPDTTRFIDLTAGFKLGSFGLINPTLFLENRIFKKEKSYLYTSLLIDFIRSKGDYPYTLFYGGENDSTSREKRENSDFESLNGEFNIYAQFNKNNHLQAKFYYYQSERGLPGATILYSRHSAQRLWDQQFFGQFAFHSTYKKIDYQLLGKINYAYQHYLDPYYLNIAGKLNNHYMQREAYLSNLVRWKISRRFQAALSNDLIYGNMSADLEQFVYPERYSSLSLLSLHYDTWRFNATASLLHTCVANNTQSGESGGDVNRLSPAIGINIKPLLQEEWFARVFFKNIYRLPTFNDLYYKDVGNNNLKPEDTYQFNIGSTYDKKIKNRYQISVTTDFYYNIVKEKIVAIPTKNLFVWAMLNFGRVEIMGLDVNTQQKCSINKKITLLLMANYSFQHAVDKTDPEAKTYGHRIPYTPKHSGSATFGVENPWVNINYLLYFNGKRYALQQNIEENILRPYTDQSFTLSHKFEIKKHWIDIQLSMTNIFNVQYEIIRNFPMQGRSFGIRVLYGMN